MPLCADSEIALPVPGPSIVVAEFVVPALTCHKGCVVDENEAGLNPVFSISHNHSGVKLDVLIFAYVPEAGEYDAGAHLVTPLADEPAGVTYVHLAWNVVLSWPV